MRDYIELTKPRITWLILMSTAVGYYFGMRGSGLNWGLLLHSILGTAWIASGTAALNQWYEREADRKMRRTMMRPLPREKSRRDGRWHSALDFLQLGSSSYGSARICFRP